MQLDQKALIEEAVQPVPVVSEKERWQAWARKRLEIQSKHWLRAANAALNGDMRELRNRVELSEAKPVDVVLSAALPATASAEPVVMEDAHQFKNFHRLLCERFGYCHDEKDWRRDQVSLIEHIAALTATASAEPVAWQPIETAPKNETWIILFGDLYGEPHGHVGFWSEDDADWFDSEAASKSLTAFGWKPTHWCPFDDPLPAQGGKADE